MEKSKKAFTMIELIFVVVIIGVLGSVAMPRLAATRDDAKVANCTELISLFMRDIATYYTSQGEYSTSIDDMSNIKVFETTAITTNGDAGEYYFVCDKTKNIITSADASIIFKFSKTSDDVGNLSTNLNATMVSITRGDIDGDLGYLLSEKNIATTGLGIDHPIAGLRTKR